MIQSRSSYLFFDKKKRQANLSISGPKISIMKTLVVYYSRTGNTRKIAEELGNALECDVEEIIDTKNRSGVLGFIRAGRDAQQRKLTVLQDIKNDPGVYDLLIIGTPTWGGNMSTPIRTYMQENRAKFNSVAFFNTANGVQFDPVFMEMTDLSGLSPIATLGVRAKEVKGKSYQSKVQEFVEKIKTHESE